MIHGQLWVGMNGWHGGTDTQHGDVDAGSHGGGGRFLLFVLVLVLHEKVVQLR